ncbi:MAG TPA: hypothetical protein VFQ84_02220 [Arenimonas sp.]|uniref:hypothetical protein n=1 Tax=Arenimonas sp. TaxID=1872635 RepID=UPI002D80592F|nr:hypothetical protein [Arenimonas sp.]HEU0152141.1 hypothetical protein [Arenimonas sp.]
MKTTAIVLFILVLSACGSLPAGQAYKGGDTVLVCHKGKKTLELPTNAAEAHINHGDRYGRC